MTTEAILSLCIGGGNLLISSGLSIGLVWIGNKTSRINTLEADLKAATNDLIDARMSTIQSDLRAATGEVSVVLRQVQGRLDAGDDAFTRLGERQQKTELHDHVANAELKQWAALQFATREEFSHLTSELHKLALAVARCGNCHAPGRVRPEDNSNAL